MIRVLGISGSLRAGSHNTALLRQAAEMMQDVEYIQYDALAEIEPFNEDTEHAPSAAVLRWRAAIQDADALVWVTPEYNGSIPGQLKNAIDWASRGKQEAALWGKPSLALSVSTGSYGAIWAQDDLRRVLKTAGARVLDNGLAIPGADQWAAAGYLLTATQQAKLAELTGDLINQAQTLKAALAAR